MRFAFGGAFVNQWFERVLDDRFGQALWRVVGSAAAAIGAFGDVDAAVGNDDRIARTVLADEVGEWLDLGGEGLVVSTSGEQTGLVDFGFGVE